MKNIIFIILKSVGISSALFGIGIGLNHYLKIPNIPQAEPVVQEQSQEIQPTSEIAGDDTQNITQPEPVTPKPIAKTQPIQPTQTIQQPMQNDLNDLNSRISNLESDQAYQNARKESEARTYEMPTISPVKITSPKRITPPQLKTEFKVLPPPKPINFGVCSSSSAKYAWQCNP